MLRDIVRPGGSGISFTQNADGIVLFFDTSRSKTISVARENITFGIKARNINDDRWLEMTSKIPSNILGYKVPRDGTITAITVQTKNDANCEFHITKNNDPASLTNVNLTNEDSKVVNGLDIDINSGDFIQSRIVVNSGKTDFPILLLEIAWR